MERFLSSKDRGLLKKVVIWRVISVALTYIVTFLFTGDIKSATSFTIFLHLILMISNYAFEIIWDKYEKRG